MGLKPGRLLEASQRIRRILHHALCLFRRAGCVVPVLVAIGCGPFAAGCIEVALLYARAFRELLSRDDYGFQTVMTEPLPVACCSAAFCLPGAMTMVNPSVRNVPLYPIFVEAFKGASFRMPVSVFARKDAITVADELSRKGVKAGILNASDPYALKHGYIGMYWDGGRPAPCRRPQGPRTRLHSKSCWRCARLCCSVCGAAYAERHRSSTWVPTRCCTRMQDNA